MILFLDLEVDKRNGKIFKIGGYLGEKSFLYSDVEQFKLDILSQLSKKDFVVGHNILSFDKRFLPSLFKFKIIDTLYLSALFFPKKPYHKLLKHYKSEGIGLAKNNPLEDSKETKKLLNDIIQQLKNYDKRWLKLILSFANELINNFVDYLIQYKGLKLFKKFNIEERKQILKEYLKNKVCENVFDKFYSDDIEFVIACNFLYSVNDNSIPPKFLNYNNKFYPILEKLTSYYCGKYSFCKNHSLKFYLKKFFNYDDFRKFGGKDLQKESVRKALNKENILVIFPTGGGKSLTYQLPALIEAEKTRKMTIIISPLLSLMKDQVENIRKKGITNVGYLNGLQNSLERAQTLKNIQEGGIDILYLAPESLRNKTIEKILSSRKISRFVIDEAHCFSKWGHDFRVDYLYLAEFIQKLNQNIKISCFTATAKKQVIEDITGYFRKKLNINFEIIKTEIERNNLSYKKIDCADEIQKYQVLLKLLDNKQAIIIFTNTTSKAKELFEKLKAENFKVGYYHGQLETIEKIKIQDSFMKGEINIIVATNAFGMGVDKDNVRKVIHWEIPSSIENYLQEAGRAGRDGKASQCIVLYNEDDLNKVFNLQRQAEITKNEFKLLFNFFKKQNNDFIRVSYTKLAKVMRLEINKKSNWATKVKVALSVLEEKVFEDDEKFIKRKFATNTIVFRGGNTQNGLDEIEKLNKTEDEKYIMKEIYSKIIENNGVEINYLLEVLYDEEIEKIAQKLGFKNYKFLIKNLLDELIEKDILTTNKGYKVKYFTDLFSNPSDGFKLLEKVVNFLLENDGKEYEYKKLKDVLYKNKILKRVKDEELLFSLLYQFLSQDFGYVEVDNHIVFLNFSTSGKNYLKKLLKYGKILLEFLDKYKENSAYYVEFIDKTAIKFFNTRQKLIGDNEDIPLLQNILYFLHINKIIDVEDGLRGYNQLIGLEIVDRNKKWKDSYYTILKNHYEVKYKQAHILSNWIGKWKNYSTYYNLPNYEFVKDYFELNMDDFIDKYFQNKKRILSRPISPKKWNEINSGLDEEQKKILDIKTNTLVIAGPGAGKTKTLIHKIASLILKDGVKENEFLMLTFTNSAKIELKSRLLKFLGKSAYGLDIHTFHSYAYKILGRTIDSINSDKVISEAIKALEESNESLKKRVIIIDEYQDINDEQFKFFKAIIENNIGKLLIIGAGDDDQNIYSFAGANLKYIKEFEQEFNGETLYISTNYRSCPEIVKFSQKWINLLGERKKKDIVLKSAKKERGEIEILEIKKELKFNEIYPFSKDIFKADTAYLTLTNERVSIVSSYLKSQNIAHSILQKRKPFPFYELLEVRFLLELLSGNNILDDKVFQQAYEKIKIKFSNSNYIQDIKKAWEQFKNINNTYYFTEFQNFITDYELDNNGVFVSTFHKSKGREFENVIIDLYGLDEINEEIIHLVYVGITRAKKKLYIVGETKNPVFKKIKELFEKEDYVNFWEIRNKTILLNNFCIQLGLGDVNIGYNESEKDFGNKLTLNKKIIYDKNRKIQRLSRRFYQKLKKLETSGWKVNNVEIYASLYHKNYFVYLPKICFEFKN